MYNRALYTCINVDEATRMEAWTGPLGYRRLRLPEFLRKSAHAGSKIVSPIHPPPLPTEETPGTHFCYRLVRHQGHSVAGKIK